VTTGLTGLIPTHLSILEIHPPARLWRILSQWCNVSVFGGFVRHLPAPGKKSLHPVGSVGPAIMY
jgi:hypothetical protein